MDSLKDSVEAIRKENEIEKQEIISYLNQILQDHYEIEKHPMDSSPSKYNYMSELCTYEQKVHHKLTELKCELKKFISLNKIPIPKKISEDFKFQSDALDIESLKSDSMKLMNKLDDYLKDKSNSPDKSCCIDSKELKYHPYVSKSTLDELSEHTKELLKEIDVENEKKHLTQKSSKLSESFDEFSCNFKSNISDNNSDQENTYLKDNLVDSENFDQNINHLPETSIMKYLIDIPTNINDLKEEAVHLHQKQYLEKNCLSETPTIDYFTDISTNVDLTKEDNGDLHLGQYPEMLGDFTCETNKTFLSGLESWKGTSIEPSKYEPFDQKVSNSTQHENEVKTSSTEIEVESSNVTDTLLLDFGMGDLIEPQEDKIPDLSLLENENIDRKSNLSMESNEKINITEDIPYQQTEGISEYDEQPFFKISDMGEDNKLEACNLVNSIHPVGNNSASKTNQLPETRSEYLPNSTFSTVMENPSQLRLMSLELQCETNDDNSTDGCVSDFLAQEMTRQSPKKRESNKNSDRSTFSAQEKILKLGLEDRMTRFEQTRQVAVLPNLRLQPSATDNEKMREIQKQRNKFEILDRRIPSAHVTCLFSHVESPSEFYIHLDDEESKLIDSLNEVITQQFQQSKPSYRSKFEAFESIGRFCCAYVKQDKTFYRAEVVDWLFEKNTRLVLIQLVDYGNKILVHYKHLRQLTKELCLIPRIAVKCYFPLLYPRESTRFNLLTEWPPSSVQALIELAGLCGTDENIYFRICYVENERDRTAVDMFRLDEDFKTLGELLIDLGHAVQIILPEDDPMGIVADDEGIGRLEGCDNINEVVLGYDPKDEGRICKFTRADGTCFKGRNCKLEHTKFAEGGFTTDQTLCYAFAFADILLPTPSEVIQIRFTTFIKPTNYYINIMRYESSLKELEAIINDKKNCSTFKPYKIMPAYGEVVLVKHWTKRWLRAKVRDHSYDEEGNCSGVQVFMVDYGDIIDVPLRDVRHIRREYLDLPFQAVECVLHNYKANDNLDVQRMDKFFYDNMVYREFNAQVLAVSDMLLCLTVLFKNRNIGDILAEHGFLTVINETLILPSHRSIVIPG